jgi:hypothetical protein
VVRGLRLSLRREMRHVILKSKKQTLIFGPMCIENVKEIPTFRTDFSNFPWQLLGACRPAGFTCLKLVAVHSAARCWL